MNIKLFYLLPLLFVRNSSITSLYERIKVQVENLASDQFYNLMQRFVEYRYSNDEQVIKLKSELAKCAPLVKSRELIDGTKTDDKNLLTQLGKFFNQNKPNCDFLRHELDLLYVRLVDEDLKISELGQESDHGYSFFWSYSLIPCALLALYYTRTKHEKSNHNIDQEVDNVVVEEFQDNQIDFVAVEVRQEVAAG